MRDEIWKDIIGYEGLYKVSNLGKVKSLERYQQNHSKLQKREERILKNKVDGSGRLYVSLCKNGIIKYVKIHHLVLTSFIGPCPEGMEACHNNDDHLDNRLENLRWDTRENNDKDKIINGKTNSGEKCNFSKLTNTQVLEIKELLKNNLKPYMEISILYKVSKKSIERIHQNKTWRFNE